MFLVLSNKKITNIKVAQHIKLPYGNNSGNIENIKADFKPYKRTYNSMYYLKKSGYITYFHTANNLLMYERAKESGVVMFLTDLFNNSYKLIKPSKLNISNMDENIYLFRTVKGKIYFISRDIIWHDNKRYTAGIDIKSGKPLFMISKENETLLNLLDLIKKHIMPIIQFKAQSISIHLVDLSSDKVGVISWNLMNIRQLIINLLRLGKVSINHKNEIMEDKIRYLDIKKDEYLDAIAYRVRPVYVTDTSGDSYIKGFTIEFTLMIYGEKYVYSLESLCIKIEVDSNKIVSYWDITDVEIRVYKKVYHNQIEKYEFYFDAQVPESSNNRRMLQRSYSLSAQTNYEYIPTDLLSYSYENDCYYIKQNNQGIMIKEKTREGIAFYLKSSLYRYSKYLIIIQNHVNSKMTFIDTEKNSIYKFAIYTYQYYCPRYRFTYHYYPFYRTNKLCFLSKDLECLIIVDMNRFNYFINLDDTINCKELSTTNIKEKHASIEEVSVIFDVKELIIKAIYNTQKLAVEPDNIIILGHHVDKNVETLYIVARYITKELDNIGIFLLNVSNNILQFKLHSFAIKYPQNSAIRLFNRKYNYFSFISNFDLYKIGFDRVNISNLDIYYNDVGTFVSTMYNRVSFPVMNGYYDKDKLVIESIYNLIIMKYDCEYTEDIKEMGREYAESSCSSSYGLLLYDLVLVRKIPVVLM